MRANLLHGGSSQHASPAQPWWKHQARARKRKSYISARVLQTPRCAVVQWYSGAVVQWHSGTAAQWCSGTVVQRYGRPDGGALLTHHHEQAVLHVADREARADVIGKHPRHHLDGRVAEHEDETQRGDDRDDEIHRRGVLQRLQLGGGQGGRGRGQTRARQRSCGSFHDHGASHMGPALIGVHPVHHTHLLVNCMPPLVHFRNLILYWSSYFA